MNVLFGKPKWTDWRLAIEKLPITIHMLEFDNISNVVKYIKDNNINIVVPCTFDQMFFLIDHKDKLNIKIACPNNKKAIKLLDNKYYFYNFMNTNFKEYIPQNYISNCGSGKVTHNKVKYPCIFKLQKTNGGKGSFIIKNERELNQSIKEKDYIIQEYISDPIEYSAHFYVDNKKILHSIFYCLENKEKNYIQCGRLLEYTKVDSICLDIFEKIFDKLNYNGFACIDFKLVNNKPKIFEINPRLGGTLLNDTNDFLEILNKLIV